MPDEAVAAARDEMEFELWPEHQKAYEVFTTCDTQWVVLLGIGAVYYQALDYARVGQIAREWLGIELTRELLLQLRVMEDEGKQILND